VQRPTPRGKPASPLVASRSRVSSGAGYRGRLHQGAPPARSPRASSWDERTSRSDETARPLERRPHRWRRSSLRSAVPGPDRHHWRPLVRSGLGNGRNRTLAADERRSLKKSVADAYRAEPTSPFRLAFAKRYRISRPFQPLPRHRHGLATESRRARATTGPLPCLAPRARRESKDRAWQGRAEQHQDIPKFSDWESRLIASTDLPAGSVSQRVAPTADPAYRRRRPTSNGCALLVTYGSAVSEVTAVVLRIA